MLQIKKLLVFLFSFLILVLIDVQNIQATEEASSSDPIKNDEICLLEEQLIKFENLKKADLSEEEKISSKEKLKKEIIISIFDCSIKEADFLKSKLNEISISDEGVEIVRQELIEKLSAIADYYKKQKEEDISNFNVKIIAKNLKTWREENYKPIQQKIASFILWVNNQSLFDTAQNRLDRLNQTVKTLKIIDQEESKIQNLIQKASNILKTAQTNNFLAKQALKNSNLADDALIFIRASLNNLYQVYRVFFELGDTIRPLFIR